MSFIYEQKNVLLKLIDFKNRNKFPSTGSININLFSMIKIFFSSEKIENHFVAKNICKYYICVNIIYNNNLYNNDNINNKTNYYNIINMCF